MQRFRCLSCGEVRPESEVRTTYEPYALARCCGGSTERLHKRVMVAEPKRPKQRAPGRKCPHSNVTIAGELLRRDGHIGAYEAVYQVACPFCGTVRRNTRLAATIWQLRHDHGWGIETVEHPGMLADYVLRSVGR